MGGEVHLLARWGPRPLGLMYTTRYSSQHTICPRDSACVFFFIHHHRHHLSSSFPPADARSAHCCPPHFHWLLAVLLLLLLLLCARRGVWGVECDFSFEPKISKK